MDILRKSATIICLRVDRINTLKQLDGTTTKNVIRDGQEELSNGDRDVLRNRYVSQLRKWHDNLKGIECRMHGIEVNGHN